MKIAWNHTPWKQWSWHNMLVSTRIFLITSICFHAVITIPLSIFAIYIAIPLDSPPSGYNWNRNMSFNEMYPQLGHELNMPANGEDKRILLLSDFHLQFAWNGRTFRHIDRLVNETNPDLIVLMGDNVGYFLNNVATTLLINKMDGFGIPWAPIIGNHDERGKATRNRIAMMMNHQSRGGDSSHSLFLYGPNCLPTFSGNYFINLMNQSRQVVHTLYFLGSGAGPVFRHEYPNPPQGQIDWYEWAVRGNNAPGMNRITDAYSTIFIHTPFAEFENAWYDGEVLLGRNTEGVWSPPDTSAFFEMIYELGCTRNIFAGHDHFNYFSAVYRGIQMTYALHTGYGWASHESLPWVRWTRRPPVRGGTMLLVGADGLTRKQHIFTSGSSHSGVVDITR